MRVVWTTRALAELGAIQDHISNDNPAAAHSLVTTIFSKTNSLLGQSPLIGRRGQIEETRELVITGTPYIVACRVRSNRVEVLFVMHGARQWPEEI